MMRSFGKRSDAGQGGDEMAEDRRDRVVEGDLLPDQQIRQAVQTLLLDIQRVERRAVEQRAEDAAHRSVDAAGVQQRHPVVAGDVEGVGVFPDVPEDVAVVLHHALRAAGRAGRVEDVGRRIRRRPRRSRLSSGKVDSSSIEVEQREAGRIELGGQGKVPLVGHDERGPGVLEDVGAPGGRV